MFRFYRGPALLALALGFLAPSFGATATIDCGSATDSNFTGGQAFTALPLVPPGTGDLTLRYGAQFSYSIPAANVPYIITFHFIEPCAGAACSAGDVTGPRQRLFSVSVNDQPLLPNLDIFALAGGALIPITRSVIAVGADSMLNITFTATVRTAVVSAIDFTPVLQPASGTPCPTTAPGPTLYAQMPDGSCLPYVIIGSTLTRPSVLIGMNVDPFPGRAELYFLEYRETGHYGDADRTYWIPGFDCSQKPPPVGSGAINPDTGLLADCMHGSMLVAIK